MTTKPPRRSNLKSAPAHGTKSLMDDYGNSNSIADTANAPPTDRVIVSPSTRSRPGGIYRGDIIVGALLVPESRLLADLMLRNVSEAEWRTEVWPRNILSARQRKGAVRIAALIRARLETMTPDMLELIRDAVGVVPVQACLAAAVKQSRLLGDFMRLVVAEQYRCFETRLTTKMWDNYIDECHERDPRMPVWNQASKNRLRSSVFQTLAQAGYLRDTKSLQLQAVHLSDRVVASLRMSNDSYALQCMEVSP